MSRAEKRLQNLPDFRFTWTDMICVTFSIVTYLADISTDILLICLYIKDSHSAWAAITLVFFIFPAIVVQVFSYRWHQLDGRRISFWLLMSHFFLVAPVHRYIRIFRIGFNARKSKKIEDYQVLYTEMSDVSMLRMFESLLESAAQLVLQTYIIIEMKENDYILTGVSAFFSLLSLVWAIVAYSKALRQSSTNPKRISYLGMFFQALWRCGMITSRILTIVLLATLIHEYTFICLGCHWLIMFIWLVLMKTDFCETFLEERLFNAVLAIIYVFSFFNVKEGKSRVRMYIFYLINFTENILVSIIYWNQRNDTHWFDVPALVTIWVGFSIGLCGLIIYYLHFHPKVDSIPSLSEFMNPEFIKESFICCCFYTTDDERIVGDENVVVDTQQVADKSPKSNPTSHDKLKVESNEKVNHLPTGFLKALYDRPVSSHQQEVQTPLFQTQPSTDLKNLTTVVRTQNTSNRKRSSGKREGNDTNNHKGVDLRLEGFKVMKDMNCHNRVQNWLDKYKHLMVLETEERNFEVKLNNSDSKSNQIKTSHNKPTNISNRASSDKTTMFESIPLVEDEFKVAHSSQSTDKIRKKVKASSSEEVDNSSSTSKQRASVVQKLAASNSFVDRSNNHKRVTKRNTKAVEVPASGDYKQNTENFDQVTHPLNNIKVSRSDTNV